MAFVKNAIVMLFNSIEFTVFLPVVFILYWLLLKGNTARNVFIVIASYVFYGWWDVRFLLLIALTTICSYISGMLIERYRGRWGAKATMWSNVLFNLGILVLFKYYGFFTRSLSELLAAFGITLDAVTLDLILPVGISFYTFQALSYTIDVYRGNIEPTRDIAAVFAFIAFFPQLVAGPIERATSLLPQFLHRRHFDYATAVDGCRQILWGLFKKMAVADNCATAVNIIFSQYESLGGLTLLIGAILFSFQIYGDFSGYSDIAIGVAKLFDIKLTRNFNLPYFSHNIREFWKRWHISLNRWFVDYLYVPLGGSRCNKSKIARNSLVVFLASGIWHGANWTFAAWGIYHAALSMPYIIAGQRHDPVSHARRPVLYKLSMILSTFILVTIGWILFRSNTIHDALNYIYGIFSRFPTLDHVPWGRAIAWSAVLVIVECVQRKRRQPYEFPDMVIFRNRTVRWCIYYIMIIIIIGYSGNQADFIYFQF